MLNIALPKGRLGEKVYKIFEEAGYECPSVLSNSRKLIFENEIPCADPAALEDLHQVVRHGNGLFFAAARTAAEGIGCYRGPGCPAVVQCITFCGMADTAGFRRFAGGLLPVVTQSLALGDVADGAVFLRFTGGRLPTMPQRFSLGFSAEGAGLWQVTTGIAPFMPAGTACQHERDDYQR